MIPLQRTLMASLIIISACQSNKKNTTSAAEPVTAPIVQADTSKKLHAPKKAEVYHASNTRTNDLLHTRLEVSFDWTNSRMNGKASLRLKPYFSPVNMLYLDARGMDIARLEVFALVVAADKKETKSKLNSSYVYENDSLKIYLGRVIKASENYLVEIDYTAKPNELKVAGGSRAITDDKGLYFINPSGENPFKMPQIWTQGETQSSSVWFPTIDSPNERMTQEIFMTVEDRLVTLSNGVLADSKKEADGRRTDHWVMDQPHAPYLAMMAVGSFKKVLGEPWNGKEVSYYVDAEYEEDAKEIFGDTREMIDFFSKKLGVPYAWPKYAQVVAHDYVSGAMENTSATLHGDFMVYQKHREMLDGKRGNGVIAHELFHQWFGDLVTCESWSNLPLNESFATYGEYLWDEYKKGRTAADEHHYQSRQGYMMSERDAHPIRFDYSDKEDMFDAISYNKGGQILHMLRNAIGDDAFFAGLKNYLETNKFKSVEIHNLRLAMEETSGQDLNWFFNQWFLSTGRPKLRVTVNEKQNGAVELIVEQKQDLEKMPLYRLPVDIDLYANGKATRKRIVIDDQIDTFNLQVNGALQFLNFDAERQLLAEITYKKTKEQYNLQYQMAPLFGDRLEVLKAFELQMSDRTVFELYLRAAAADASSSIRLMALSKLEKAPQEYNEDLKRRISDIYITDANTLVKARALSLLNKRFEKDAEVREFNEQALREQSYAVCGEALEYFSKVDPTMAMERAKVFENESGKDVIFPIAALYAEHGTEAQAPFFHNALKYFNGFDAMSFISLYAKLAKRCNDVGCTIFAAGDFESFSLGANKFVKHACAKGIKDLITVWDEKGTELQKQVDAAKAAQKDTSALEAKLKEAKETKDILNRKLERVK